MRVTLATHCHYRDLPRLHAPGILEELINCHQFPFDEVIIVHQRCKDLSYTLNVEASVINVEEEDYERILNYFGIPSRDAALTNITHDFNWQWYYEHHCVNHLAETLAANSDFIVFCDADCRMIQQNGSWVNKGIELLNNHPEIFIVAPSEGGHDFNIKFEDGTRLTRMTSQQLFMARTVDMKRLDFTNLQWDGKFIEGGPFQEWYGLLEGWLYRHMQANNLYRAILPEQWRYLHMQWH